MQKEKESLQALSGGQRLPSSQNIIPMDQLARMVEALIGWCDSVEKYGLVDYEIGIWEEEILEGTSIHSHMRALSRSS